MLTLKEGECLPKSGIKASDVSKRKESGMRI
jgi:hypothetical protein